MCDVAKVSQIKYSRQHIGVCLNLKSNGWGLVQGKISSLQIRYQPPVAHHPYPNSVGECVLVTGTAWDARTATCQIL